MFNVSVRERSSMRERLEALKTIDAKIKTCRNCSLCEYRTTPLSGKFVEPTDAIIIDLMPHESEDKAGELLTNGRDKSFGKLFALAKPSLDLDKISYVTALKCYGPKYESVECLGYLDEQIRTLDPVLIIVFGKEVLRLVSGKEDLELGVPYVTGDQGQYMLFGVMYPRDVIAVKETNIPIWKKQLEDLGKLASKYDLKIFK